MPDYYISAGVRRSLVARELGRPDIAARVIEPGQPDRLVRISLGSLYSPKAVVPRDWRYLRVLRAVLAGRILDPIEVEPLGAPQQSSGIALSVVVLQ